MFGKRIFFKCLMLLYLLNNNFVNAELRDPFKPVKKIYQKEFSLNATLISGEKKFASVTYNDKHYTLTTNEKIEDDYLVKEIKSNELVLMNLETNQEKIILLPN